MAITNSGMTLYTNNDNESGWSGTDGPDDYSNAIQGSNSESWQVSKNATETGTLTKSADMSGAKFFTFYMASNLAPYYTSIKVQVRTDSSNYYEWTSATSDERNISGDFHPVVLEFDASSTTGTPDKSNIGSIAITVDNSSSGNIRSVINNWIDTMHYGSERIISGSTESYALFRESHQADVNADTYDGCSEYYKGSLAFQTDVVVDTTDGTSSNETVVFTSGYNTNWEYNLTITGTARFFYTLIKGGDDASFTFSSENATSFEMYGGGFSSGGSITFKTGQTISGAVFSGCEGVVPNGSTFQGNTINNSYNTGLYFDNASHIDNCANITFDDDLYPVSLSDNITGTVTFNNFKINNAGVADVYWAGTSGTLTINMVNGTNFSTSETAGGTVEFVSSVSINVNVKDQSDVNIADAYVYIDEDLEVAGSIANTQTDSNGNVSTSYSGSASTATIRVRKYGYKPYVGVISLTTDSNTNVILISDPQQV